MNRVLVLGYIWPYHPGSGARIPGLVRHLPEFGWEPIIVTKPLAGQPDLGCRIVETPYRHALGFWLRLLGLSPSEGLGGQIDTRLRLGQKRSVRKAVVYAILKRIREIVEYPDLERGWKPFALEACTELLQANGVKAIISTSPPVTSHLVARELRVRHGVPWIADFPHLWSQNNSYPHGSLRRLVDRRLEKKVLRQTDVLTTTSEPFAAKLRALHNGRLTHAITHGFDPSTVNVPPVPLTEKFTVTYTGTFRPGLREPGKVLAALHELILDGAMDAQDLEVRFYGAREAWVESQIEACGLSQVVRQYDPVPIDVSWQRQRESQVLLVPKWEDSGEPGVHSLKIFEYLAARRPILAVGGHADVVDELLDETGAGTVAPSAEAAKSAIKELYQEYKAKGGVTFGGHETKINAYSHRGMAQKFAQILDQLGC